MFSPLRRIKFKSSHGGNKNKKNEMKQQGKLDKQWEQQADDEVTSPTSVCSELSISSTAFANSTPIYGGGPIESPTDYEYGEAEPDVLTKDYGYGEAEPDISTKDYGYGEAEPDVSTKDYGYGEAEPDISRRKTRGTKKNSDCSKSSSQEEEQSGSFSASANRRTPRRSSMKQYGQPRRSSIQCSGETEVELPNTGKKVRRRTSISFNEGVQVKPVARVMDLTENPERLWFQDDEYDAMRERCYNLVDKVESGQDDCHKKKPCVRGLEGLMEQHSQQKQKLKLLAWDSVLDVQDEQMDSQTYDDQAMANALKLVSIESRVEAARRAKQDEEEVQKYLSSTRRRCRRLSC